MITVSGTEPYPWPYDGLHPDRLALVVAGWDCHWEARVASTGHAVQVATLADAVRAAGGAVVCLHHAVPARAPADAPPSAPLAPPGAATILAAGGIDGFCGSALETWLRANGRTQLLVVGHGLEAAVHSTMRSANDRGVECLLVADACGPLDPSLVPASQSSVCMSGGIFGAVGTTADVVAALALVAPPAPTTSGERP